jgi:hypothetical protein
MGELSFLVCVMRELVMQEFVVRGASLVQPVVGFEADFLINRLTHYAPRDYAPRSYAVRFR